MAENFYQILGVEPNATSDDIKKAYRTLARKYHPDINKESDAELKFKAIAEAYDTLSDDYKRRDYDQSLKQPENPFYGFDPFSSIFSQFMGGSQASRPKKGADIHQIIDLTFEESVFGTTKPLRYSKNVSCSHCDGSGSKSKVNHKCKTCNGAGRIISYKQNGPVMSQQVQPCHACGGNGFENTDPCVPCSGSGLLLKDHNLSINMPPGSFTGLSLRVDSEGHACSRNQGPSGNLLLSINVKKKDGYSVEHSTLTIIYRPKLSIIDAMIGAAIKIPAPDYSKNEMVERDFSIKPGTKIGQSFRVVGQGLKSLNDPSKIGPMVIEPEYDIPAITDDVAVNFIKTLK
ncbi:hypothetical protein EBS02_09190 [bacterium]|nr:hypothetical protein [bacterium]